ncbi:MAG: YifB family Mg chelatase-like AAA ATPase [Treponema sp.]|nr:YifB family Mg chelatase-like AAA ATPase [Candidatus Treponema scatequi]
MQIFSFSPFGYEGSLVTVEVDLRRGIPAVDIVGLADGAVKESRERMRSAIRNSGFEFPLERVLISLSPADLRKEGAGFDLAVALGVLSAAENHRNGVKASKESDFISDANSSDEKIISENILVMGELELSGKVRSVRGVHAAVSTAVQSGILYCIVPKANADEAREVDGVKVFAAENLEEAFSAIHNASVFTSRKNLKEGIDIPEGFELIDGVLFAKADEQFDFSLVKNQMSLTRALQIAACGGHNVLAFGPPGCGKTLCMQRFGELLPALTVEEAYPVTRIHSLSGILKKEDALIRKPPFRMPHQTASIEGICGGGVNCRPGEISLAHNGVLFLDEACEFRSSVLQMMRVPLESKTITLSRAGRTTTYPANFQLLMATNPCPCGNFGSKSKICLCSARSIEMYWSKFSGPLLDRVDIRVKVESRDDAENISDSESEKSHDNLSLSTLDLRKKIAAGRKKMIERQGVKNAGLRPDEILKYCVLEKDADRYLKNEIEKYDFSPRAVSSILKISRTVSDMNGLDFINLPAVKEAVEFRKTSGM